MALPRPAFLGLIGLALILATFLAVHGIGPKSSGSQSPVQTTPQHVTKAVTPATKAATPAKATHKAATTTAKPTSSSTKSQTSGASVGLPVKVAEAFAKHQVVVIYFGATGADDTATAASVKELKASSKSGVTVFTDKLSNLADYRRVVGGLDVSQAPSIVIVDRDRKAQLLEGFIDAGSLRQSVADVTR
jgi:cytoskeletal protein RodZ